MSGGFEIVVDQRVGAGMEFDTRITKPVSIDNVGALSAQSEQPILFENIVEKPGFRLCDILVKHRPLHARALGVKREHYLRTLAYRLRLPPRELRQ